MNDTAGTSWQRPSTPLGTLVYRAGLLSKDKLELALTEGQRTGRRLGEILLQKGWIEEKDLARLLAGQKGLPFVSLKGRPFDRELARRLGERVSRFHCALSMDEEDGTLVVAIADPTDESAVADVEAEIRGNVRLVVATASEIRAAHDDVFAETPSPVAPVVPLAPPLDSGRAGVAELGLRVAAPVAASPEPGDAGLHAGPARGNGSGWPTAGEIDATGTGAGSDPQLATEHEVDPEPVAESESEPGLGVGTDPEPDPFAALMAPDGAADTLAAPETQPEDGTAERLLRVVVVLDGGDEVEVGTYAGDSGAEAAARDLVIGIARFEEWPRVGDRFLRPDRIVSVDIRDGAARL